MDFIFLGWLSTKPSTFAAAKPFLLAAPFSRSLPLLGDVVPSPPLAGVARPALPCPAAFAAT